MNTVMFWTEGFADVFLVQTVVAHYAIPSVWNAKYLFRFKVSAIDSAALDDADLRVRH